MNRIVKPDIFDYNTNKQLIEDLVKEYPFLKADISGRTVLGRGIFSFSVGSLHNSVIMAGGFHGDDGISPLILYMFIEDVCKSIKEKRELCGVNIRRALSQLGITVIPSVNPDGRELNLYGKDSAKALKKYISTLGCSDFSLWQSNAKGIDISSNFGRDFEAVRNRAREKGIDVPCASGFTGDFAESEPETKALTRLCRLRSFRQCLSLSTGNGTLISAPDNQHIPESELMSKIISQGCLYPLLQTEDEDICGFPAWFSKEFSRPAFELRADSTAESCDKIYERVKEALTVFSLM